MYAEQNQIIAIEVKGEIRYFTRCTSAYKHIGSSKLKETCVRLYLEGCYLVTLLA